MRRIVSWLGACAGEYLRPTWSSRLFCQEWSIGRPAIFLTELSPSVVDEEIQPMKKDPSMLGGRSMKYDPFELRWSPSEVKHRALFVLQPPWNNLCNKNLGKEQHWDSKRLRIEHHHAYTVSFEYEEVQNWVGLAYCTTWLLSEVDPGSYLSRKTRERTPSSPNRAR